MWTAADLLARVQACVLLSETLSQPLRHCSPHSHTHTLPPGLLLSGTCPFPATRTAPSRTSCCSSLRGRRPRCHACWSSAPSGWRRRRPLPSWETRCGVTAGVAEPWAGRRAASCTCCTGAAHCSARAALHSRLKSPPPPPQDDSLLAQLENVHAQLADQLGRLAHAQGGASAAEQLRAEPVFCLETGAPRNTCSRRCCLALSGGNVGGRGGGAHTC